MRTQCSPLALGRVAFRERVYIGQVRAKLKVVAGLDTAIIAECGAYLIKRLTASMQMLEYIPVITVAAIEPIGLFSDQHC